MTRLKFFLGPLLFLIFSLYADQLSKSFALNYFKSHPQPYKILPVFDFVLVWNRGISWGMFNQEGPYNAIIFSLLSIIITLGLLLYLYKVTDYLKAYALSLIISGAIGNLIDRLRFSAVVDFIHFHWNTHSFPAFNVADTAITIGAFLLILDEWLINKRKQS